MTPVTTCERARCTVGIANGAWCVQRDDRVFAVDDEKGILPFVSCLEEDVDKLRSALREGLLREGLDPELESAFPYTGIIETVFRGFGEYWIDRALDWMEVLGVPANVVSILESLIVEERGTQQERHRAGRLLKRERRGT